MKKNYLLGLSFVALFLLLNSCSQEEDPILSETAKTTVEPDFIENDGSMDESEIEEEAPAELNQKSYGRYNYTLLKPSKLDQEKVDGMCGESTTMSLLVGSKKKKVGQVKVMNDGENLYLTFAADEYKYMKKVYLNIGAKGSTPYYSNGFPNLRKFNFKAFPYYFGGTKNATYVIPLSSINTDCFEIVAYAKVYDSYSRCFYTSFAYDENLTQTYSYSYYSRCVYYNEWVRSFEYCIKDCKLPYESAFGFCHDNQQCFTDDGFDGIGWTNGPISQKGSIFNLYAQVEGCDATEALYVGKAYAFYSLDRKDVYVEYNLEDTNYVLLEASVHVGSDRYPLNSSGEETINPEEFPYRNLNLDGVKRTKIFVDNLSSGFYLIPHAKVKLAE